MKLHHDIVVDWPTFAKGKTDESIEWVCVYRFPSTNRTSVPLAASTRRRCAPPTSSNAMRGRLQRPARGGKEVV